jgi:hypothetical protein
MRNFSETNVDKIKTHISWSKIFFPENRAVYEKIWKKNMVGTDMPQMTIRHMRFACGKTKVTDTHSEHTIVIAFAQEQWLREHSSKLRVYVQCLPSLHLNPILT